MLKDIVDGLKIVSDGIKSVKTIAEAVRSGAKYLKTTHPEVQKDVLAMVEELRKNMTLIKRTSAVLTNFRFAVSADVRGPELKRFNDYFIHSKEQLQHLEDHIDDLRTHCSKIRTHAEKIGVAATAAGFAKVFAWLGLKSPEREQELGNMLDQLAYEDFHVAGSAAKMLECLKIALNDVQDALGDGGTKLTENVPAAAALLAQYGSQFERMEDQAEAAVKEIRELAEEMQ